MPSLQQLALPAAPAAQKVLHLTERAVDRTSKGLSVYIVAAFIKRLAQLALVAPTSGCLIILPCIYNLLVRHPTCKWCANTPAPTCFAGQCARPVGLTGVWGCRCVSVGAV